MSEPKEKDTTDENISDGTSENLTFLSDSLSEKFYKKQKGVAKAEDGVKQTESGSGDAPEEVPTPLVLKPDHPMMERFQAALKNHLLRQIDRLSNQVYELDKEMKDKEKEREDTGLQLYTLQQEIFKQQKILEDCDKAIDNLMSERQLLDESIKEKKNNRKEEVDMLNSVKKKEMEMKAELNKIASVSQQMEKWKEDMEGELTVSQRISEKTQQDKIKLIEEKRKLDMYLLRLMTEISNYESEIKLLEGEIDLKLEEKDTLNQSLADAAADLQALITEQKRLMGAWNSVVAIIGQRNVIYTTISKELTKCQETFRSLNSEIDSYKRSASEEMRKNEKLSIILDRFRVDKESGENALTILANKKAALEDHITSTAAMIERTEAEYRNAKLETEQIEVGLRAVKNCYERLNNEKRSLEDQTMNCLQDQIINDKSASHLNKLLREAKEKTRLQEFHIVETENKISQKFLKVEELKAVVAHKNEIIEEMNKEVFEKEQELKKLEDEIAKCHSAAVQKQGNYAALARKIEKQMEKTGYGKLGPGTLQMRIVELEKANSEIQVKNEKMQNFWLVRQQTNVKLSKERNEQIKEISLLRRQVQLLEQTVFKTDVEFMNEKKIENDVTRSIGRLQRKLVILNDILVDKKGYQENLGKENSLAQAHHLQQLKDTELEQVRLQSEIKVMEKNLEELAETMLATQREMLAWDKKIKSAVEAKNDLQREMSSTGEIGQMKTEIHRMEVRYSQLKKVQEKLINDLEQCVLRRDRIVDLADAEERRHAKENSSRMQVQKKVEVLKKKIRSIMNERKKLAKLIENAEDGNDELRKNIQEKEAKLKEIEEMTKQTELDHEEKRLLKLKNLEMLIRRQKKCKMYELLKSGKHKLLFKNEEVLDNELQKARNKNATLISIAESLIQDFPGHRFQLKKIYNTFKAEPS